MFKLILITFLSTLCISFAQEVNLSDISNLSEDGKKEYFRNYLNVKSARFGKSTYNGWVVYQGLDKQLTTKEFLKFEDMKDIKFSKNTTDSNIVNKNFLYNFFNSVRQKINEPIKKSVQNK